MYSSNVGLTSSFSSKSIIDLSALRIIVRDKCKKAEAFVPPGSIKDPSSPNFSFNLSNSFSKNITCFSNLSKFSPLYGLQRSAPMSNK